MYNIIPFEMLIAIHPPRAGWDLTAGIHHPDSGNNFNPPTPCGVGRLPILAAALMVLFQSTHPVRGGTTLYVFAFTVSIFQSTHPVRGGTVLKYS